MAWTPRDTVLHAVTIYDTQTCDRTVNRRTMLIENEVSIGLCSFQRVSLTQPNWVALSTSVFASGLSCQTLAGNVNPKKVCNRCIDYSLCKRAAVNILFKITIPGTVYGTNELHNQKRNVNRPHRFLTMAVTPYEYSLVWIDWYRTQCALHCCCLCPLLYVFVFLFILMFYVLCFVLVYIDISLPRHRLWHYLHCLLIHECGILCKCM